MNYTLMNDMSENGLIYDENGNIQDDFKKHFAEAYKQYYYDNTLKGFVDKEQMNTNVEPSHTGKCFDGRGREVECGASAGDYQFPKGSLATQEY
jgi:hypothetical protein